MAKKTKVGLKVPTLNEISKRYGNSVAMNAAQVIDHGLWLPSTFYALNNLTGGGIPYGKIIEIAGMESSGKSLVAYDFAYTCQQLGGHVIWVDAEQSWTNSWAEKNGLNLEMVTLIQDTQVEQISDAIADIAIYWRSQLVNNEPILLVLDSIAAMDTIDSINAKMVDGKAEMGGRAKAIYKMFRIRNELLYKLGVAQIYINQLRISLSTGFGQDPNCLHYDTNIPFADGTSMKIGEIVKNKISKPIWAFDEETNTYVKAPITGWVKKEPEGETWYQIKTEAPGSKNGINGFKATDDHYVLRANGEWDVVQNLKEGDELLTMYENTIHTGYDSILAGVLVGDCSCRMRKNHTANLVFRDSQNPAYVKWKTDLLRKVLPIKIEGEDFTEFEYSVQLGNISKKITEVHEDNKRLYRKHLKVWELYKPTWLSLAIWYMDDGHLYSSGKRAGFSFSERRVSQGDMITYLKEHFGLIAYRSNVRNIKLEPESTEKLFQHIAKYIPPCMEYKLPEYILKQKIKKADLTVPDYPVEYRSLPVKITHLQKIVSGRTFRRPHKYDLSVNRYKNFLAGNTNTGVVVHNTTTGGKALGFYASIRLSFFGGKSITVKRNGKDRRVGRAVTVRVMKNKVAPPKATLSKAPMYFDPNHKEIGFDRYFGMEDVLVELGIIQKSAGGVYKYKGETLCRGEEKFRTLIEEDQKLRRKLLRQADINTISATKKLTNKLTVNLFPIDGDIDYESQVEDYEEEVDYEE